MRKLSVPSYENNNVRNNATASKDTCGRISFKGTLASETVQAAEKWTTKLGRKLYNNRKLQGKFSFPVDNKLIAEALVALVVTCTARPLTIMATPTKSAENKEKNKYAAAKSIASGLIGLGATFLIATPFTPIVKRVMKTLSDENRFISESKIKDISRFLATKKINENISNEFIDGISKNCQDLIKAARNIISDEQLEKIYQKAQIKFTEGMKEKDKIGNLTELIAKRLRNEASTMDTFLNKIHSPASLPLKAKLTIALVPVILGALGLSNKKKTDTKTPQQIKNTLYKGEVNPVFKNIAIAGGSK